MIWLELIFIGAGFALGSVLFSYHIPKIVKGIDIVKLSDDHNPGTANAMKLAGVPVGLCCLLFDMLKGFLPVFLAINYLGISCPMLPLIMAAPLLGHALAPEYPFRGGKCIATAFGVLTALLPISYAVFMLVFWYLFFSLVFVINPHDRRSAITFLVFVVCCIPASILRPDRLLIGAGCVLIGLITMERNFRSLKRAASRSSEELSDEANPSPQQ